MFSQFGKLIQTTIHFCGLRFSSSNSNAALKTSKDASVNVTSNQVPEATVEQIFRAVAGATSKNPDIASDPPGKKE